MTTANASSTIKEGIGYATAAANTSTTLLETLGSNPSSKAIATTVVKEVVGGNPSKNAVAIQTIKEVILLNSGAITVDIINNVALQVGIGNEAAIFNDRLKATSPQVADSQILYTIVTPPTQGYFLVDGTVASTFTQGQIDAGLVIYVSNKLAYRYEYEARDTLLFTDETPNREQTANLVEYISSGSTVTADSFVFTFSAGTISPPGNSTFNIQLINEGFVVNNALLPGQDGMLEMPVESELFEMPVESETMEMWS